MMDLAINFNRECRCVLLLDARLALRRVVVDERQLSGVYERPQRLCYTVS